MTCNNSLRYLSPTRCFSAAINIPQCARAQMNKNKQEDVCDFFVMFIDYFDKKFQPLVNIFQGNLLSTFSCQRCSHSHMKTQPFRLLSLPFPSSNNEHHPYDVTHDLYSLLNDFIRPELISGYNCTHCGAQNTTEKTLHILSTPNVLVIQLKRFKDLEKINDHVMFPTQLGLQFFSAGNQQQQYRITGAIVHMGSTIENGHYVAYINHMGRWFLTDDTIIQEVAWERVADEEVYILFYERL